MADFVEREKIQDVISDIYKDAESTVEGACIEIWSRVKEITAADVRPVVTCGKCKHGKYTGTEWFCDKHSGHADKFGEDASYHEYHSKHWFCADGEARM